MSLVMAKLIYPRPGETCMLCLIYLVLHSLLAQHVGCVIFKLNNEMCLSVFSVTMLLPCFLCVMLCLLHFYVFMHLHLACHLGTLDEPREGRDGESS